MDKQSTPNDQEFKMTHAQLSTELVEALTLIKRDFDVRTQSEALRLILEAHYPEQLNTAREVVRLRYRQKQGSKKK